jgi:hypothetical protein
MSITPNVIRMGTFSPSEAASPKPFRQWPLALLLFVPLAFCGLIATVSATRFTIPEVRPAYPTAQLVSRQTLWDMRGFHTLRTYQVPAVSMRDVLEWYFNEDILARYGPQTQDPPEFSYVFSSPSPAHALSKWLLASYSQVDFVVHPGFIKVTTDTHFYWRTLN